MLKIILTLLTYLPYFIHCYFDFELYHNLTEDEYQRQMDHKKNQINTLAMHGFGRILTWNVKKLGACLRQDNVEQLKEVVCVVLQSANIVVLQEAENLDLSCLPCATVLKDEYEWPGSSANDEFRILVKTRHSRSFSVKKLGVCDVGADTAGKKSHFDDKHNIYQAVMRQYQRQAEKKQYFEREYESHELRQNVLQLPKERSKNDNDGYGRSDQSKPQRVDHESGTFIAQETDRVKDKDDKKHPPLKPGEQFVAQEVMKMKNESTSSNELKENSKNTKEGKESNFAEQDSIKEEQKGKSNFEKKLYQSLKAKLTETKKMQKDAKEIESKYKDDMSRAESLKENGIPANTNRNTNPETVHVNPSPDNQINENSRFYNDVKKVPDNGESVKEHEKQRFLPEDEKLIVNEEEANFDNDKEMSARQKERFHSKEEADNKEEKKKESEVDKKSDKEKEVLKERLNKNKQILDQAKKKYKNGQNDRFKVIDKQLKTIEKELKELNVKDKKEKKEKEKKKVSNRFQKNDLKEEQLENKRKESRFKSDGEVSNGNEDNYNDEARKANRFHPNLEVGQSSDTPKEKVQNDKNGDKSKQDARSYENDYDGNDLKGSHFDQDVEPEHKKGTADEGNKATSDTANDVYTKVDSANHMVLKDIDLDSDQMHNLVHKVLSNSKFIEADDNIKNEELLEKLISKHNVETTKHDNLTPEEKTKQLDKRSIDGKKKLKKKKKNKKKKKLSQSHTLKVKQASAANGEKRQLFSPQRDETLEIQKNLNYVILTIKSDLNSGDPFILANVRFPKEARYQRACMEKIIADISNVNSEYEKKLNVLLMGDFHFDRLSGADAKGELYKIITNLQIDGENYHSPITYLEKDPITTVYGRRFDNILSNINSKGNIKTIGPDFPLEPESVILPITLQRLYNNYITALYTTDNDESDKIYECIKAFQMAGKKELEGAICKNTWVPSSYISDHLPLQFKVKMSLPGKTNPVEVKLASWNIQGDTFKERLLDPSVRRGFLNALKQYHVAVFHEFPPHDRIIDDQELGSSDIVRLKQGAITTEFGIYVSEYVKDGETDMYVLRKKFKDEPNVVEDVVSEVTPEDTKNLITTVGLFAPKIVVDTVKIRPCLYTVKTSKTQTSGVDFSRIINAIDKDVQERKCDFKVMLASLNLEENFDLDKEIYKSFKYINLKCLMTDGDNSYKYNIPRSRDLADYVIVLGHEADFEFAECTIGLPGDEYKRGIDKLSDFEELTTHYPLSMVVKQSFTKK